MAYYLVFDETTVSPYLRGLNLSKDGRNGLERGLRWLSMSGDQFIANPALRLSLGSDCFRFHCHFFDQPRGTINSLLLVVSDAAARYGVLEIRYAELQSNPIVLPN